MAARGETELGDLAAAWGLAFDGRTASGYVAEEAEPWDGSDDPPDWKPPRDLGLLLDELGRLVPGTVRFRRSSPQGGLVRVELELEPDGECVLPAGWTLELGGVGHCGAGGWMFHYFPDSGEDGPGKATVSSGEDGRDTARERVEDRDGAGRVFARHGSHW